MSKSRPDPSHDAALAASLWAVTNNAGWKRLLGRLQAIEEAETTLGDATVQQIPLTLERSLYDVYLAVEEATAGNEPRSADMPTGVEVLEERFGEKVNRAREIHKSVEQRLQKAERLGRKVELIDDASAPSPHAPRRSEALTARPLRREREEELGAQPRPSLLALVRHLNVRAPELGFAATTILRKQQGKRGVESRSLRDARARVVAEMYDDFNASLQQLADLFGVKRNAVAVLRDRGRELRQEHRREEKNNG